ncbi:MAG: carboxyl transferase domain-containing protein [Egibacteraceae bacterium]
MADRRSAAELIEVLTDPDSFEPWFTDVVSTDPLAFVDTKPYRERLADANEKTSQNESIVTGQASVRGHALALIVGEFGFLAGTQGVASAERVVRAFERAVDLGLPMLALPVSGGTRMQEGTVGFVQMAKAAAAVQRFRDSGLPYVVWLRHPTTGGVLASWASLGQLTLAQPEALLGMTGPRVIELLEGSPFPEGIQTAEHLHERGVVDDVCRAEELAERVGRFLGVAFGAIGEPPARGTENGGVAEPGLALPDETEVDPWEAVRRSRRTDRPGIRELLTICATDTTALRGDDAGTDDPGCLALLARVSDVPVVLIGHDRPPGERGARLTHAGYRKARRAMELAQELHLPLVTIIDTAGAVSEPESEERGLAAEIARCLATMSTLEVPTLSLLLGEGTGGGALAFLPADRVIAAEHAWLAPIAPEGASAILYRTTDRAEELAASQAIASTDLRRLGLVDVVVPDRPRSGEEGASFGARIAATAARELRDLIHRHPRERRSARLNRYRVLGH